MHDVDGCDGDDKELPSGFGLNTTQPTPTLGAAGYILLLPLLLLVVVDGRSLEVEEHLMKDLEPAIASVTRRKSNARQRDIITFMIRLRSR